MLLLTLFWGDRDTVLDRSVCVQGLQLTAQVEIAEGTPSGIESVSAAYNASAVTTVFSSP